MAEIDRRKAALIAEIEVSRGEIRAASRKLEASLDFVERTRNHVSTHLGTWLGGATIGGFILSRIFRNRSKSSSNSDASDPSASTTEKSSRLSGMVWSATKFAFDLARPALTDWVLQRFSNPWNKPSSQTSQTQPPAQK